MDNTRPPPPPKPLPFSGWCEQALRGVFLHSLSHAQGCSDTSSVAGRAVCGRPGGLTVPPAALPRPSSTSYRNRGRPVVLRQESAAASGLAAAACESSCEEARGYFCLKDCT
jgi:hypothetical protein